MSRALVALFSSVAVASAIADPVPKQDPVAEVTQFQMHLQDVYNSPEFRQNPEIALLYFDTSEKMRFFDIMMPPEYRGSSFRKQFIDVGTQFQGEVEFLDMEVQANDKLAFVTLIQHYVGKTREGTPFDLMLRTTDCLEKSDGRWRIVHEHVSLPLDDATLQTLLSRKP